MLSRLFLIKNKKCCGEGCLMCPYEPKHTKNTNQISKKILLTCTEEELSEINDYKE